MDRTEILKSAGFSKAFIDALHEFEKAVPNVCYETPFKDNDYDNLNIVDTSDQIVINRSNDNYSHNIIIKG